LTVSSITTILNLVNPMQTDVPKHGIPELLRFSGQRYDQLWRLGVLSNEDRIELLDGQIVRKPEVNSAHWHTLYELHKMLLLQLGARALVANQSTIRLPQDGRPDPDIVLVRLDLPRQDIPEPSDIYLLIEVVDSTLERDRQYKLPLYARDNILEYWIVDIENKQLEVYRDPQFERYLTSFTLQANQDAACLAFPDDFVAWYDCLA
jgi:Uma2 family endonuclease